MFGLFKKKMFREKKIDTVQFWVDKIIPDKSFVNIRKCFGCNQIKPTKNVIDVMTNRMNVCAGCMIRYTGTTNAKLYSILRNQGFNDMHDALGKVATVIVDNRKKYKKRYVFKKGCGMRWWMHTMDIDDPFGLSDEYTD
jgi:hypothetical protein